MPRGLTWIVTGSLLLGGALVAGCPDETTTSEPVRATGPKARDYFLPSSATLQLDYEEKTTNWPADGGAPDISTSSFRVRTVQLTQDAAEFKYEVANIPVGSVSVAVASDGTVNLVARVLLLGKLTMNIPDVALTSDGATVTQATGSVRAQVLARVAKEAVTVPGGSFSTLKTRLQVADGSAPPTYYWLAKGMGFYGVKQLQTATRSYDTGVGTTSTEVVLTHVTP